MSGCDFCQKEVEPGHYNCQQELEARLIHLHGIGQTVLRKAGNLRSKMQIQHELQQAPVQELLAAIDPFNLAMGSAWASYAMEGLRLAEFCAEQLARGDVDGAKATAQSFAQHKKVKGFEKKPILAR
jgi:hypothetical protein